MNTDKLEVLLDLMTAFTTYTGLLSFLFEQRDKYKTDCNEDISIILSHQKRKNTYKECYNILKRSKTK